MSRRVLFLVTAFVLTWLYPAPSSAGGTPDARSREAGGHFDRAVKFFGESDFRDALIEFERAYAIAPNYLVQYDMAMCRYQLHDYAGALGAFEKYLADAGADAIPEKRREAVQATISELRGRVARVQVSTDIVGAQIEVDDVPVGVAPLSSPVVVSVGRRKFAATKNGWPIAARTIDLAGEDYAEIRLVSDAPRDANRTPATVEATPPVPARPMGRPILPAIASFVVALGGVGVGSAFAVAAIENKRDLDGSCVDGACPASARSLIDRSQQNANIATVAFSVGLLGLAAGVVCLWIVPSRREALATRVTVRPLLGIGSIAAVGTF